MLARKLMGAGGFGGGPATFEGFTIDVNYTSNYVTLYEFRVVDHDDVEWALALTPKSDSFLTYNSISAGEVCGNGTDVANQVLNNLQDGSPDISSSTSAVGGQVASATSSSGLKLFFKPSISRSVKYLDIAFNNYYGYAGGSMTLYAGDSETVLTPSDSPANSSDVYQTTGNSNGKWYRWTYPEDPT